MPELVVLEGIHKWYDEGTGCNLALGQVSQMVVQVEDGGIQVQVVEPQAEDVVLVPEPVVSDHNHQGSRLNQYHPHNRTTGHHIHHSRSRNPARLEPASKNKHV